MNTKTRASIDIKMSIMIPLLVFLLILIVGSANVAFANCVVIKSTVKPSPTVTDENLCLPCHGSYKFASDPSLNRLFISKKTLNKSFHKNVKCIKCHTDLINFAKTYAALGDKMRTSNSRWVRTLFVMTPYGIRHSIAGPGLYTTANLSCRNCKEHLQQEADYSASVHSFTVSRKSKQKPPTCSTCHGSHYIIRSIEKDQDFHSALKSSAKVLCGKCHLKSFESYDDTYHGKSYKAGSISAPACWDCHGAHFVRLSQDPESALSNNNIEKTCGKCHRDSKAFLISYTPMIHGRQKILDENPVVQYKNMVAKWIDDNIVGKIKKRYIEPLQAFLNTKYNEYLNERDKAVTIPTRSD
jgi:hypothetical protein